MNKISVLLVFYFCLFFNLSKAQDIFTDTEFSTKCLYIDEISADANSGLLYGYKTDAGLYYLQQYRTGSESRQFILNSFVADPVLLEKDIVVCSEQYGEIEVINPSDQVFWFRVPNGGKPFYSGKVFSFPGELNAGNFPVVYTYYVENRSANGDVSERVAVTITVRPSIEVPLFVNPDIVLCSEQAGEWEVINPSDEVLWYETLNGGQPFYSGKTYSFPGEKNNSGVPLIRTYYVENKPAKDCNSKRVAVTVTINPEVSVPVVENVLACANQKAVLEAKGVTGKILWYDSMDLINPVYTGNPFVTPELSNNTGTTQIYTYYAVQEIGNCLSEVKEVRVSVISEPAVPEVSGVMICSGIQAELEVTNVEGDVFWYDSPSGGNLLGKGAKFVTPVLENTTEEIQIYTFYAEQSYCENVSLREKVEVQVLPMPGIGKVIKNKDYIEVIPKFGSITDYEYSIDKGTTWQVSNIFSNLVMDKAYYVQLRDRRGCIGSEKEILLPAISNFISPNGDGYNDVWSIKELGEVDFVYLRIFNRSGKILYETNHPDKLSWDGKYLGNPLPTDNYWYIFMWKSKYGEEKNVSGWIILKNSNNNK